MAILLLVNERGNLPVAGKNSDRNGAATVLCEQPDVARPKILYEIRGDSFAGWKFRRGRNDSSGLHSVEERRVTGRSMPRRTFDQDVAGQFTKDIFHQPLFGVEARVGHEEDSRRTGSKLDH